MAQEIEIEFKTMLTEKEFHYLHNQLPFPQRPIVQINYYFETEQFTLKDYKSALRIREKNGQYTLTLKEPHEEGILETHDILTEHDANEWLQGNPIAQQNVTKQLAKLGIDETDLRYYGPLTTKRFTYRHQQIDYMLDESSYHGIVDYELEIEAPSYDDGLLALQNVLREQNIVERKAKPKIARFFQAALL